MRKRKRTPEQSKTKGQFWQIHTKRTQKGGQIHIKTIKTHCRSKRAFLINAEQGKKGQKKPQNEHKSIGGAKHAEI